MVKYFIILSLLIFSFIAQSENFKPVPVVSVSINEAWQRQQVLLTLEIPTPDEFARLEVEELDLSGFEVVALPFKRVGRQGKYTVKIGWILFPLVTGYYEIELPKIVYRPNSGRKIKLKTPLQKLTVKALPSYIPVTMPIGKVMINNTVQAGKLGNVHETQKLINWNVELITRDVLPQIIPPLLRQIKTSKALDIFPETLDKKTNKTFKGLQNNYHYKIPIKALQSGALNLPSLSIQYFDPQDGMLKRAHSNVTNHWAINRYLQWVLLAVAVVGLAFFASKLFRSVRTYLIKKKRVAKAIQKIRQAKDVTEVRIALHDLSKAEGLRENTTLARWLSDRANKNSNNKALRDALEAFQEEQFSGEEKRNVSDIALDLINKIK
ncbi:MAG: hypothetical protein V3U64_03645 [Cocleimonas sp.]